MICTDFTNKFFPLAVNRQGVSYNQTYVTFGKYSFVSALTKCKKAGVNNFNLNFGYHHEFLVVIKVGKKYNLVKYSYNQYMGYIFELLFKEWVDEIILEKCFTNDTLTYKVHEGNVEYRNEWNNGTPRLTIPFKNKGKFYMAYLEHNRVANISETFDSIGNTWNKNMGSGYVIEVYKDGKTMLCDMFGNAISAKTPMEELEDTKQAYPTLTSKRDEWVSKGKPIAYRCGYSWKGAWLRGINANEANEYIARSIKGGSIMEIDFELVNNKVILVFQDYTASDME